MSAINTSGINANYPVAGVNNSTQGFRDNFASIKNNLNSAGSEITDLQDKAIVKAALSGATLNNNMENTLISNALVKGFRSTFIELGPLVLASAGTATIDTSKADVIRGTVTGDITLAFSNWGSRAPAGTRGQIELILNIDTSSVENPTISLPDGLFDASIDTIENYDADNNWITAPYGVTQLTYIISTLDCGTTLSIAPANRNRRATQLEFSSTIPAIANSYGRPGDTPGQVIFDSSYIYFCTDTYTGSGDIWVRIPLPSAGSDASSNWPPASAVNTPTVIQDFASW